MLPDIPDSPEIGDSSNRVIADVLTASGYTELARFPYRDGFLVVAEGPAEEGDRPFAINAIVVEPFSEGWVARDGGGASWDRCLSFFGSGDTQSGYFLAVAGDPSWTLDMQNHNLSGSGAIFLEFDTIEQFDAWLK